MTASLPRTVPTEVAPPAPFQEALRMLLAGIDLPADLACEALAPVMAGEVGPVPLAAFLTAMAAKGPTPVEVAGLARAMRAHMVPVPAPAALRARAIDTCGTGGDGQGTFNISTAVAFVVAASGVPVAKHGNRSATSKAGGADVLEALGVGIDVPPEQALQCLETVGMAFLFAPRYHPAMRHVGPVRRELGFPTVFNLLGPLCNPVGPGRQMVGVYRAELVPLVAGALRELGTEAAFVVHGAGGLDEFSLAGANLVVELKDGALTERRIDAADLGLAPAPLSALAGGDATANARLVTELLTGDLKGPPRDVVVLNAAAALALAGRVPDLAAGVVLATEILDSREAFGRLEALRAATRTPGGGV